MVRRLCQKDDEMLGRAVEIVTTKDRPLGRYLAVRCHLTVAGEEEQSCREEACRLPHNQRLHGISNGVGETLVIRDGNRCGDGLKEFSAEMESSSAIAVIAHMMPKILTSADEIDMLSIRMKTKVFAILPKVYPGVLEVVATVLCKFEKKQTIFVYKAKNKVLLGYGEEVFGWRPSGVVDVFDVCMKRGWSDKAVAQISKDVVGGQFCCRA